MYYVYVLQSKRLGKFYTGFTGNLKQRLKEHNSGYGSYANMARPFTLVYCEVCITKEDALTREKYLKSGKGKAYLKGRLKYYLGNLGKG